MKLDINRVWQQASAAVAANREVLAGVAGVFILLPRLAFELFTQPAPVAPSGASIEAMAQLLQAYYAGIAPWLVAVMLVETTGTLALLALITDRSHPTVGQAIRRGAICVIPYLMAQLLFVLTLGLIGGTVLGLAAGIGSKQVVGVILGTLIFWSLYAGIRLALVAPVIVVGRARGPLAAILGSWRLTRGHTGRIFGLLLMIILAMAVSIIAASGVIGSLGTLIAGKEAARIAVAVVASLVSSTFTIYVVAVIAALHRQLSEASAWPESGRF